MNSALTDNQAGSKARRIARFALRGALACALAFGAGTAFAQQYGGGDRRDDSPRQQQSMRERFSLPQQDRGQREAESRAYEDQRRAQQQYQQQPPQQQPQYGQPSREEARRASGRLTPDERRDLRRQINEAGDLYQNRR